MGKDELLAPTAVWLRGLRWNSDKILTAEGGVGIGVVGILRDERARVILVRKARRRGYQFGDLLALPGGMIRGEGATDDLRALAIRSLRSRLLREAGVAVGDADEISPANIIPPPVTGYTAKGQLRFTVVLPFTVLAEPENVLTSTDMSVSEVFWAWPPDHWSTIAPANRYILCRYLWSELNTAERAGSKSAIEGVISQLESWAKTVNLPGPQRDDW